MHNKLLLITTSILMLSTAAYAKDDFDAAVNKSLDNHFNNYKDLEYFSGIALTINAPKLGIKNYYIGEEAHDPNSKAISASSLFQIGSITKSFTAAVILQLEQEKKLSLKDPFTHWLPNYGKWANISIQKLLNMTSGIPNYSDTPLANAAIYNNPSHVFTNTELIDYVYPIQFTPPLKNGFFYTNTAYILADMIIEKITDQNFSDELKKRTIDKAKLTNTFYPVPSMPSDVYARLARGYNYNPYDNPRFVGQDVTDVNISWASAAGAIVSNSEEITKWVKALFTENTILDDTQKSELVDLVSFKDGNPIKQTSAKDPFAFGLGIGQMFDEKIGRYFAYEGETLGYRAFYIYVPCNNIVISAIFNSATDSDNDRGKTLIKEIYALVLNQYPQFNCKSR